MYESISLGFDKGVNTLTRFIKIYDDTLSKEDCEFLIQTFDDSDDKYDGQVATTEGIEYHPDYKNVQQVKVEYESEADNIIQTMVGTMINNYAEEFDWYPPSGVVDEGYHIKRYAENSGFYRPHTDNCTPTTQNRLLAMVFYLNTVAEGGETEFCELGLSCQPQQGRCLIFPADVHYVHAGNKPISGPKYISNVFIGYERP